MLYSDKELLKQLKDHYKRNNGITRKSFDEDKKTCSSNTICDKFGGWNNSLKKAGLPVVRQRYTKENIIKQMQEYYLKNGKISATDFDRDETVCSVRAISDKFGSWNKALDEAGIKKNKVHFF